jgi:trimethylamine--corrinoid protein Co-methyltransferase
MNESSGAARRGGREARRSLRQAPKSNMLPTLKRGVPVFEVMDPDQVERVHKASLSILEDVG